MADLQSCYFCASPDDAAEYAVVPPRLGGGDRSVVLCPDCKTKLLRVMEPLIERAEGDDDAVGDTADAASTASTPVSDPGSSDTIGQQGGSGGTNDGRSAAERDESGGSTGSPASAPAAGDDSPPQYRRAIRMLSNRPFPMDRGEVESMLAAAYDLEREEIAAVLEHAEAEGRLVAENGELRER